MSSVPKPNSPLHTLPPAYDQVPRSVVVVNLVRHTPPLLKTLNAFVLFKYAPPRTPNGKRGKVPYYVNGEKRHGTQGSAADLAALCSFDIAVRAYSKDPTTAGIGICALPSNPVTFLDLDHCIDRTSGALNALAQELVGWGAYTEVSPGGEGLRIVLGANLALDRKNAAIGLEVFSHKGFLTLTALPFGPAKPLLQPTPQQIERLHALLGVSAPSATPDDARSIPTLLTKELLPRVRAALKRINPDLPRDDWIKIGQALHSSDPSLTGLAFNLWLRWSSQKGATKFTGAEQMVAEWKSFGQQRGITLATLFHIAKSNQYPTTSQPLPTSLLEAITPDQVQPQELDPVATGLFDHIGAYLLVGRAKIGKSRILGQLIAYALIGEKFLGFPFVKPCRVLALALEEDAADVIERCRLYMVEPSSNLIIVDQNLLLSIAERITDDEYDYLQWLDGLLTKYQPRLVCLDSLVGLRMALKLPVESAKRATEQDYQMAAQLQKLAVKHKCVLVATIHGSKRKAGFSTGDFDPFESIGTTSWTQAGCAGTMVVLDQPGSKPLGDTPDDMRRVFSVRTRYRKIGDAHMMLQYGQHGTIRNLGEYHHVRMTEQQTLILRLIRDANNAGEQWVTGAALAREAGMSVRNVRGLLERFRRSTSGRWEGMRLVSVPNRGYRLVAE